MKIHPNVGVAGQQIMHYFIGSNEDQSFLTPFFAAKIILDDGTRVLEFGISDSTTDAENLGFVPVLTGHLNEPTNSTGEDIFSKSLLECYRQSRLSFGVDGSMLCNGILFSAHCGKWRSKNRAHYHVIIDAHLAMEAFLNAEELLQNDLRLSALAYILRFATTSIQTTSPDDISLAIPLKLQPVEDTGENLYCLINENDNFCLDIVSSRQGESVVTWFPHHGKANQCWEILVPFDKTISYYIGFVSSIYLESIDIGSLMSPHTKRNKLQVVDNCLVIPNGRGRGVGGGGGGRRGGRESRGGEWVREGRSVVVEGRGVVTWGGGRRGEGRGGGEWRRGGGGRGERNREGGRGGRGWGGEGTGDGEWRRGGGQRGGGGGKGGSGVGEGGELSERRESGGEERIRVEAVGEEGTGISINSDRWVLMPSTFPPESLDPSVKWIKGYYGNKNLINVEDISISQQIGVNPYFIDDYSSCVGVFPILDAVVPSASEIGVEGSLELLFHSWLPVVGFQCINEIEDWDISITTVVGAMIYFVQKYNIDGQIVLPCSEGAFLIEGNACMPPDEGWNDRVMGYVFMNPKQFVTIYGGNDLELWKINYLDRGNRQVFT